MKTSRVKTLYFFILHFLLTTVLFAGVNVLKGVEIVNGELKLTFSKPLNKHKIKHFTLSHPYRHIFDFPKSVLAYKHIGKGINANVRIGQFRSRTVRVVIENNKRYRCSAYSPLFAKETYHMPLPKQGGHPIVSVRKVAHAHSRSVPLSKPRRRASSHKKRDLIVIDAGHGGHDPGAVGGGKKEKDLVLSIARRVAKSLRAKGYGVYMTRNRNRFLKLSERTHIADRKGAVAFISIHANAVPKRHRHRAYGVETYFLQKTRDAKSQRIATRENKAVLKGAGSKLSKRVIVDSVLNGPKIVQSNKLAIDVQRGIISRLRSKYKSIKDGGVRHAPFYVLVGASRPSILVEVGYISNPRERKRLFTAAYQKLIAKGIATGVDRYLCNRKNEIDL